MAGQRYIHGEVEHFFGATGAPSLVRLVFDRAESRVTHCLVGNRNGGRWQPATRQQIDHVKDSMLHGNEEAIDTPEAYGMTASDDLPDWAGETASTDEGSPA